MEWGDRLELGQASEALDFYGVYRVQLADTSGTPVPLGRICGVDTEGVLYVGRSGFGSQGTFRTVARRLREFQKRAHSGGQTYAQAKLIYDRVVLFQGHRLFATAMSLPDAEIARAEERTLRAYFQAFGELPPLNSAFPGKGRPQEP